MAQYAGDEVTLVFTLDGKAELENADENIVWSSDDDGTFRKLHADELLGENDSEMVLLYLASAGILDEDELGDVIIEVDGADFEDITEPDEVLDR